MKKLIAVLMAVAMLLPAVFANSIGGSVGIDIPTEDFEPRIWMCDSRFVSDDNVEWGRITAGAVGDAEVGAELLERNNNYAFEGEQIAWTVLVMDKNGIEKIEDVYVSVGKVQGSGNEIEVNCDKTSAPCDDSNGQICDSCNARIDEEQLVDFDANTMDYYRCTLTVEGPQMVEGGDDIFHGEYWVTANVVDLDGLMGSMDENEYWFFNPAISLTLDGSQLTFGGENGVRPGTQVYSNTLTVGNGAEDGSGVLLDMFISGTDFYDPAHSGAKCPTTNKLDLHNFAYFATNGAYSSADDATDDDNTYDPATTRTLDQENYVNIQYGDHFARAMYNEAEILQANPIDGPFAGDADMGYGANLLAPGAEMSLTFKLDLPEPCNGDFSQGSIFFWGEAV